jgi:hypothetical protein
MTASPGWPLVAVAAWLAVNALAILAGARVARRRGADVGAARDELRSAPTPARHRAMDDGYVSLLLNRLVVHARRMLDVDQAILLVREPRNPQRVIVVAAHGTDADVVGRSIPIRGVLRRLVSDRPLLHGPLHDIVPSAGLATSISAAAPVPSGELAVLCAASEDRERGFTGHELELLADLAGTCAAAIADVALGARLEPTMRVLVGGLAGAPEEAPRHAPFDVPELAAQVGVVLGLEAPALAELDMAARACKERLVDVPGLEAVAIVVRFLGERWDGHGGPHGLLGEQIPLASRILAACLALRESVPSGSESSAAGRRRLKAHSGAAFDPVVVDAIAHVLTRPAAPLDAHGWARADVQYAEPLAAVA